MLPSLVDERLYWGQYIPKQEIISTAILRLNVIFPPKSTIAVVLLILINKFRIII